VNVRNLLATIFSRAYYWKGFWNGCQELLLASSISDCKRRPDWNMFLPDFGRNVFGEAGAHESLIDSRAVRAFILSSILRV
jgi:hypothetical protein